MYANVVCVGKHEFTRKDAKTAYVVELIDFERKCVYKAFTSKKHYDTIKVSEVENFIFADDLQTGYVSFENGFTKFYLPKDEVK
jgi:hypothetical protein